MEARRKETDVVMDQVEIEPVKNSASNLIKKKDPSFQGEKKQALFKQAKGIKKSYEHNNAKKQ
jgi:hypothetical protein